MQLEKGKEVKEDKVEKAPSSTILRIKLKEIYYIAGAAVIVFFLLVSLLFYFMGVSTKRSEEQRTERLSKELQQIQIQQTHQSHLLVSQITYGEERQRIVLFLRDTIFNYWKENENFIVNKLGIPKSKLTVEKAFRIAEIDVSTAEIYPSVDALLLAALQFQESRWGLLRKSESGAIGLNHFMPSTGAIIASAMDLSFDKKMLDNDKVSTEMAAKYLDMMYSLYGTWGEALADYNGGPWSAYYYKIKSPKLNSQTAEYVPEVLDRWSAFRVSLNSYNPDINYITKDSSKEVRKDD